MRPTDLGNGLTFWRVLASVLLGILFPWLTWLSVTVLAIKEDVAVIKGNRFTSTDAIELRNSIEANIPPAWFHTQVNDLEQRVRELERR